MKYIDELENIFSDGGLLSRHMAEFEFRGGQLKMAEAVRDAFSNDYHLIVEAGTGTGKTLAYLLPAVALDERVVISTGTKNLQEQIQHKDIPFIRNELDVDIKTVLVKGRNNYLCRKRLAEFAAVGEFRSKGDITLFHKLHAWSSRTDTGDIAEAEGLPENLSFWSDINARSEICLGSNCPHFDECYITKLRRKAAKANILLVNHHLLFADLALKMGGFGEVLPDYRYLIFDEAHLIESVAQSFFGYHVSDYQVKDLLSDVRKEVKRNKIKSAEIDNRAGNVELQSTLFFRNFDFVEDRMRVDRILRRKEIIPSYEALRSALTDLSIYLKELKKVSDEFSPFIRRIGDITVNLENIIESVSREFVYWAERRRRTVFLNATPIKVDTHIRPALFDNLSSVVLTSATLTVADNFDFILKRTGFNPEKQLILPSEFDFERKALLYVPQDLPLPSDAGYYSAMSSRVLEILEISDGGAFLLFTSFRGMNEAYEYISENSDFNLFMQGDLGKRELLEMFRNTKRAVLLATMSFWQGVDIQGEDLRCVIIDKLPFAVPSEPIISATIEHLKSKGANPFSEYQVPSSVMLLKQGLGRLIRHREDYGIAAVMDKRLLTKHYGKIFLNSLPPFKKVRDIQTLLDSYQELKT